MIKYINSAASATGVLLITLAAALGGVAAAAETSTTWNFDVYLDDKEIGYHRFDVSWKDDRTVVESEARFAVKILFLNAYSYSHDNTEYWSGGCLTRIDAQTDDNGKTSVVSGRADADEFRVETGGDTKTLETCVKSFAYWTPDFLKADKLLNAQTGEYTPAEVIDTSDDVITINGEDIPARRITLSAGDRPIKLWYRAEDGAWLQLVSTAAKDRELRYTLDTAPGRGALPARRLADALDILR